MRNALFLSLAVALCPHVASAENVTWRVATVISSQQAGETVRRGVAIFSNGEPAIVTLRLRPTAAPSQGKMPFSTSTTYKFEDGSAFTIVGAGLAPMSPEGVPLTSETLIEGKFESGSGRFAGVTGSVSLRSRSGLDRTLPGVLGDQFSSAEATYTLPK